MFSVVIPLYNKEDYIGKTIQSVLHQTYSEFEIIVVNDSSTDRSLKVVESFKDSRIKIYTIPNGGVSIARNYGIQKATHEIIAFLDSDDVWEENYLYSINELILRFPNAGLYASAYSAVCKGKVLYTNRIKNLPTYSLLKDYFETSFNFGLSINITSATCLKREIATRMSMFRESIKRGEDIDVWLRVALKYPVAFCNKSLMRYTVDSPTSLSRNYTQNKDDFPYLEWLQYKSASPYFRKYVILAIYISAKNSFYAKDYINCFMLLKKVWRIELFSKGIKRLYLLIVSFLKK